MRISIEATILADPQLTLGRVGPSALTVNGQQIVDDAEFFRAAAPTLFNRGSAGVTLQFSVERFFATLAAAEAFALTHSGAVPREGLVTCLCGEAGDTQAVYLRNAILETVLLPGYKGRSVGVQYTIRGAAFESDVPPEEIPGEPDDGEGVSVVVRRGKVAIDAAADSVDVAFSAPLAAVPAVAIAISRPAGSPAIGGALDQDSVTVNGFTVTLDAATPDGTYTLNYIAIE